MGVSDRTNCFEILSGFKLPPVFFTTVRSSRNTSIARGVTLINNMSTSYQKKVIKLNPLRRNGCRMVW